MINVDGNVINWLIKVYPMKNMLGILVIVSVNDFTEYVDYENCKCRRSMINKFVEECNENIYDAKITEIKKILLSKKRTIWHK